MKVYEVIVDDGRNVFKASCCAKNRKALDKAYGGNGRFVEVKDVTDTLFKEKTVGQLEDLLTNNGWSKSETVLICELFRDHLNGRK